MNTTLIYIGDDLLDLFPNTIIATTLKASEIGDLRIRLSSYTNSFKVPLTPNNNKIYQHSNKITSDTLTPYRKQSVKIVQNGVEVLSNAIHYIRKVVDYYEIYIVGGVKDFFDVIGEKKITDLADHPDTTGIDYTQGDFRNNTTGLCEPVMNQGDFYIDSGTYHLNEFNVYLVSMYYHTVINRIIESAGYQKTGNIFNNEKYLNMALLCTGSSDTGVRYNTETFSDNRFEATNEIGITTSGLSTIAMPFENVLINNSGSWNGSTGRYNISHSFVPAGKVIYRMRYLITITVTSFSSAGTFRIGVSRNGAALVFGGYVDISAPGTYVLNMDSTGFTVQAAVGEYHEVQLVPVSGTPVADISYGKIIGYVTEFLPGVAGNAMFFNRLLPKDILQKDFIRHFLISFGLLIVENNGMLIFKGIDEVIQDKINAKNWTYKLDPAVKDQLQFTPLEYSQSNLFKYNIGQDVNEDEGIGNLSIDNQNAKLQSDFYKTDFNASGMVQVGNIFMLSVPTYALGVDIGLSTFQNSPGKRIFLIRDKYSFEPDVEFIFGTPYSDYRVAYFSDPEQRNSMSWQQFIDDHYKYLSQSLQKAKIVTRRYNLTEIDIIGIDFLTPIFDTDSYFIVNEVKNFVPGKVAEVQLLKII